MDTTELRERAEKIKWYHTMDLGQGVITHGCIDQAKVTLPRIGLPESLAGRTVLDIGAWDGFYAFECERRGAEAVMAVDSYMWVPRPEFTGKAGFHLAHEAYKSRVYDQFCDVIDLDPRRTGRYDVVLFLGVLYHMRHPLLALERVAKLLAPGGLLIVETHVVERNGSPMMEFYPGSELGGDPSNWWGPNVSCASALLSAAGLARVRHMTELPQLSGRAVFHAECD
jgi:tRNA (mo5U34)-methyltransferase